jgi:hypothetical protein
MIVSIVSLGLKWMDSRRSERPILYNTTGLLDRGKVRCRSRLHGTVRFLRREIAAIAQLAGSRWISDGITEWNGGPRLALRRCTTGRRPDRYLVTVTHELVGWMTRDASWNGDEVELVSMSENRTGQEAMLLTQPFAWVRGDRRTLHLVVSPHDLRGSLQEI